MPAVPLVLAAQHEGVLVLELRAPPANTDSYEMMRELDAHILDARMNESVHVLMLTGARPAPGRGGQEAGARVLLRRGRHQDARGSRSVLQV